MGATVTRLSPPPPQGTDGLALALRFMAEGTIPATSWDDADILVIDDLRSFEAFAGGSLQDVAARHPATVFGVSTVYGLTGPLAGVPASALDAQAVSSTSWVLGEAGRAPLSVPPGVLECQAGAHLAAACLAARQASRPAQGGQVVDIALADVLAAYVAVNCRFYIHHGMQWARAGRRASNSGGAYPFVILPCKDGDVCLSGRTRPEWERFVQAMGSPDWAKEPRYTKLRAMGQQYPAEVDALILPWLRERTKAEIASVAHEFQLTIAPLREFDEILATPQLAERGFLKAWSDGGATLSGPGLPFHATAARSSGPDFAGRFLAAMVPPRPSAGKPLAGLRVLDFGWVWSAPQMGSILAQLGAEVIKVEHGKRLDNARMSGTVIRDGQKVEGDTTAMSPMFHQINKNKLGITLNTKLPEGVALARRLAAVSDVVLENMSVGSIDRAGLGYAELSALNPRLVMVAMTGAGQFGPLADMRTYAPAMSSFAGMESLVGYPGERPVGALNFAVGDPNAAVHGLVALFGALARRDATGSGCYVDLSQTEALLATLAPYMLQAQAEGRQPEPVGNAHHTIAPHGIYRAAGADRWVSLAAQDDAQWAALADMVGVDDERFSTAPGRIAARAELDQLIEAWTAGQDRDALVVRLREAGIPAAPVQDIGEMWNDEQLTARGMKGSAELPGLGQEDLFRAPWLFSDFTPPQDGRGPLLGEHNGPVLKGLLGLTDAEFDGLVADGVIA